MSKSRARLMNESRFTVSRLNDFVKRHPKSAKDADFADALYAAQYMFVNLLDHCDNSTIGAVVKAERKGIFVTMPDEMLDESRRVRLALDVQDA